MRVVVSDTSPIRYLILIDAIHVLSKLTDRVVIPEAVQQELLHPNAPPEIRQWFQRMPEWLEIRQPSSLALMKELGPGESHAITLAQDINADAILVDDLDAREAALRVKVFA